MFVTWRLPTSVSQPSPSWSWQLGNVCLLSSAIDNFDGKKISNVFCFFWLHRSIPRNESTAIVFPTGMKNKKKILMVTILLLFHDIEFLILFFSVGDDKRKKLIATLGWWGSFKLGCRMTHHMRLVIMMCGGLTTLKGMCPASHSSRRGIKDAWPRRDVVLATPNVVVKFCVGRRQPTDFRISKRQFKPTQLLSLSPRLDDSLSPSECSLKMQIGI